MPDSTMFDASLIKENQLREDGLVKADLCFKSITVVPRTKDDSTLLKIAHNGHCVSFELTPAQCRHLSGLLLKAADRD